jgi:hypothetical protein
MVILKLLYGLLITACLLSIIIGINEATGNHLPWYAMAGAGFISGAIGAWVAFLDD